MTDDIFKIKPSKAANIEKYEDFTIYGVNKVIDKLRMLQKGRRIITAYFDEGRQSLMTAIIDAVTTSLRVSAPMTSAAPC